MSDPEHTDGTPTPPELDLRPDKPHSARMWNFWLGGKDHYPADEALARQVDALYPQVPELARASRAFQDRAVRYLAERGVDQFIDLGTGLPTAMPTHRSAQEVRPTARIVYVDNDPIVLLHARALLTSAPEGVTAYIDADLRDPDVVLTAAAQTLDLTRPTALLCMSTLGHVPAPEAADLMHSYTTHLAPGSYLGVCDTIRTPAIEEAEAVYAAGDTMPYTPRTPDEITACARGLEILPPGLAPINCWLTGDPESLPGGRETHQWGYLAAKRG